MACALQTLEYVHTFIICLNSGNVRFDQSYQDLVRLFIQIFGPGFQSNLVLCFTHWDFSKKAEAARRTGKKKSQERYITEYSSIMFELFDF